MLVMIKLTNIIVILIVEADFVIWVGSISMDQGVGPQPGVPVDILSNTQPEIMCPAGSRQIAPRTAACRVRAAEN